VAVTVRGEGARDKEESFFHEGLSVKEQEQLMLIFASGLRRRRSQLEQRLCSS